MNKYIILLLNSLSINKIILKDLCIEMEKDKIPKTGSFSIEFSSDKHKDKFIGIFRLIAENKHSERIFTITVSYIIDISVDKKILKELPADKQDEFFYKLLYPQLRSLIITLTNEMGMSGIVIPSSNL